MTTPHTRALLALLLPVLLLTGCDSMSSDGDDDTLAFEASFFTDLQGIMPDENCGDPQQGRLLNIQEGQGESPQIGAFTVRITFCVDATDLLDDGQLTEGESIPYDNGAGVFTTANGDALWFTSSGAVLPSDHPDFAYEFMDPFEFTGGTGRFEGAHGNGMTDSLVDLEVEPSRTQHRWSGVLTLGSEM